MQSAERCGILRVLIKMAPRSSPLPRPGPQGADLMASTSLPASAKEATTRVQRGRDLYTEHANEIRFERGSWYVPSNSVEGRFYAVRLGPVESCECPDHTYRGARCQHVTAAVVARAKSTKCACCGNRVPWRFVSEVQEEDELLSWFVGDRLCSDCVRGGFWA